MQLIEWFFTDSIFGVIMLAVGTYFLAGLLQKHLKPSIPHFQEKITATAFLIFIFTILSIPRYLFESDIQDKLQSMPWAKVASKATTWELFEPITWFFPPVNHYEVVALDNPLEANTYRIFTHTYDKPASETLAEVNCANRSLIYSYPNKGKEVWVDSGVSESMTNVQYHLFCEADWEKEGEALRAAILKNKDSH